MATQFIKAAMIDIESLDVVRTAAVIQVGVIIFEYSKSGTIRKLDTAKLDLPLSPQEGRTSSIGTLAFWLENQANREVFESMKFKRMGVDDFQFALASLTRWLSKHKVSEYWFQGPTFDAIILEDLIDTGVPWKFYQVRDMRTVEKLLGDPDKVKKLKSKVTHDALEDCEVQLEVLRHCLRRKFNG